MAKAREKIDSIGERTKDQYHSWKKVLSGALNDPQLILSLSLLLVFYVFLTGFNAVYGDGTSREENALTCSCQSSHRAYYQSLIIISIIAWCIGFFLIAIYDAYKFWRFRDKTRHPEKYLPKRLSQSSKTGGHDTSFLERAIDSVEAKAEAIMKIPVQSLVTKTLDIVDDGVETLRAIDDGPGLKSFQENPIDTILTVTMESVKDAVVHKLQDNDGDNDGGENKSTSEPIAALIQDTTELIDIARQDSILGKVVKPLDEKVQAVKETVAGFLLTNLITSAAKIEEKNPIDDNTQASPLLKTVIENPSTQETNDDMEMKLVANTAESKPSSTLEMPMKVATIKENGDEIEALKQDGADDSLVSDDGIKKAPIELLSTRAAKPAVLTAQNIKKQSADSEKIFPSEKKVTSIETYSRKQPEAPTLSQADRKTLQRIKHYENFLWMEFYKVYSVGADIKDDSSILPSFLKILGYADTRGTDGGNVESDTQPLLLTSSYDGAPELPSVAIEPDLSDEDSDVEDFGEISDTKDVSAASNSAKATTTKRTTVQKEVSLTAGTTMHANKKVSTVKHQDDTLRPKSSTTNSGALLDASTKPGSALTRLSSQNSDNEDDDNNDDNDDKNSFYGSWIDLRPEGLYTDIDEDNTAWLVADVTCASVGFFLYPFLVIVRLLAQIALIPLLLFQTLGTYPWICITDHYYCRSVTNQYRLGIDTAAVAFTFYCCILIAVLSTTILQWFPCSKDARSAIANCIS